jgi:polysaccharide chain length determinant protein (PEP-CTERM system associated)
VLPGKKYLPEDLVRIAWRRKWFILIPFVVVAAATNIVSYSLPNVYRSSALIAVMPQRITDSYIKATVTTKAEDRLQTLYQKIQSRTYLERAIQEFNLYPRERRTGILEDVVAKMQRDILIEPVKGDVFRVSYSSPDPRTAMKVTERLAGWIVDESHSDRKALAQLTTDFLAVQLENARRRLEAHEAKLAEYKKAHSGELPTEREANLQVLANTQMQVQALIQSMNQDRDRRFQLEKQVADLSEPPAVLANVTVSGDDPTSVAGGTVAAQLEAAKAQLRLLELKYKPDYPDVGRMKRIISDLEAKAQAEASQRPLSATGERRPSTPEEAQRLERLKTAQTQLDMLDRQIAGKQAEEKRLRGVMAVYQARIEATAGRESEMTGLMRDYSTLSNNYQTLLAKQEDSKVAANMESQEIGEQFTFLDQARLPEKPVSPNRPLINLVGAAAGLAIGLGFTFVLEYRDTSMRTDDEVVSVLALPVVAVIPLMLSQSERNQVRRRSLLIGSATAVFAVCAVLVGAWFFLRYQF